MNRIASGGKVRRRKVRFRLWYLAVLAVLVWVSYEYFFVQNPILSRQEVTKAKLNQTLLVAKRQYQSLNTQFKELHENNYISYLAEKKYNLVKPGELLFVGKPSASK